jgi:hypothetical protein
VIDNWIGTLNEHPRESLMKRKFNDEEDERTYNAIIEGSGWSQADIATALGTFCLWFISVFTALALLVVPAPLEPLVATSDNLSWHDFGIALFLLAAAVFAVLMSVCNLVLMAGSRWRDNTMATRRQ